MFKHAASQHSGRDMFKSTRLSRLKRSVMRNAIRKTDIEPSSKEEQERGPPQVLAAA